MIYEKETDNHILRENVTTNEKYILRKMGLKFHRSAFHISISQISVSELVPETVY